MYKVFINDRAIILTDKYEDYKSNYDCLYIRYLSNESLFDSINLLASCDVVRELCVYSENLENLWENFTAKYKTIEAAGGVVKNNDRVLMIMKKGHWDLPKGKIDGSESIEEAAVREVAEECGLDNLQIDKALDTTYHLYLEEDEWILKKTYWFQMQSSSEGPLTGDQSEGITDVQWVNSDEWTAKKEQSYPSIHGLLDSFF